LAGSGHERHRRLIASLLSSLLSLAAVAGLLALTLEQWLPRRHSLLFPEKAAVIGTGGGFDVAFLGSSRVYRHVNPRVINRALATSTLGRAVNLGVPGLTVGEQFDVVEKWLSGFSRRPRYVVIEPILNASLDADNLDSERVIRFHTPSDTGFLLRFTSGTRTTARRKVLYSARHLLAFAYYWLNYGKVASLLRPATRPAYLDPALDGFMPLGEGIDPALAPRESSILGPGFLAERIEEALRIRGEATLTSVETEVVVRLVESVRRLGAEPVLFLPPRLDWDRRGGKPVLVFSEGPAIRRTVAAELPEVPLLDYTDPREFPEFYRAELWYDATHLGTTGAALFSERLAFDLERVLQAR
jgi:hypothetical protein